MNTMHLLLVVGSVCDARRLYLFVCKIWVSLVAISPRIMFPSQPVVQCCNSWLCGRLKLKSWRSMRILFQPLRSVSFYWLAVVIGKSRTHPC